MTHKKSGQVCIIGLEKESGLYEAVILPTTKSELGKQEVLVVNGNQDLNTWHQRLEHVSYNAIQKPIPWIDGIQKGALDQLTIHVTNACSENPHGSQANVRNELL